MNDRVVMTEAEREALNRARYLAPPTLEDDPIHQAVEAILAARLEQVEDARDEQERMVMQVRASADEWWGKWERENARAENAEAGLADLRTKVEALADWWARSGDESGYDIACADHARQLRDLLEPR